MTSTQERLESRLAPLADAGRLRTLKTLSEPARPELTLGGKRVVDFCSNDYLGLSCHPQLIQASQEALLNYGTGTGGARLIGGTLDLHTRLEQAVAQWKGTPAALVFNSGYQANVGVLSALIDRHAWIFADRLNHASLVDGAVLSRAKHVRYTHLDMDELAEALEKAPADVQKFIVTDSVFSMDGDQAPLKALFELACRHDAWLIVDEAHGTGLFGNHRSGLWETTGIGFSERVIQIGTFSKALGSFGAYVAASESVVQALLQFSRSFIYSTSLPPAVIAANLAAVELIQSDATPTDTLWKNIEALEALLKAQEIEAPIIGPIIPIILGDSVRTLSVGQALLDAGFYVQAIRPPTVPEGTSRLRVTLSALHQPAQLEALALALKQILAETHPS